MATEANALSKKDLASIQNYLASIKHKWEDIGVQLKLDPEYLESLSNKQNSTDSNNMRKMVLAWLTGKDQVATWKMLCQALRSPAVDEVGIAERIEREEMIEKAADDLKVKLDSFEREHSASPLHDEFGGKVVGSKSPQDTDIETSTAPAPPKVKTLFPFMNTSGGLSAKEKEELHEKLLTEFTVIRFKFAELVISTKVSLLSRGISPADILNEAKDFGLEHSELLAGLEDAGAVMGQLNERWGFCEHSLLEHIITKFGTDEDREKLENYKKELSLYSQRRIFECPEGIHGSSVQDDERHVFVRRRDPSIVAQDMTLDDVLSYTSHLRGVMGLRDCNMAMISCGSKDDSLDLTFGISQSLAEKIFPLTQDQQEQVFSMGMEHIMCNEYFFQRKARSEDINGSGSSGEPEKAEPQKMQMSLSVVANETVFSLNSPSECKDEDVGIHTCICINNKNLVVEVSNSSSSDYKAYKVGHYKRGRLEWKSGKKGMRYGRGRAPRIALNDEGYLVEVDEESPGKISYRVGIEHYGNAMLWTESSEVTHGSTPSIALCYKTAILAFRRESEGFYKVGTLNTNKRKISWSKQEHRFINGISDLSLTINSEYNIVAVYTKELVSSIITPLYAIVGTFDKSNEKILFSSTKTMSQIFSSGRYPSIAINQGNNVFVISSYLKSGIQKKVNYRLGVMKKNIKTNVLEVEWMNEKGEFEFSSEKASVAMNDKGVFVIGYTSKTKYLSHTGLLYRETPI